MNVRSLIQIAFSLFVLVPASYPAERFYSVSPLPYGFDNPGYYSRPYDGYRPYYFNRPGYYPYYNIGPPDGSKHHHHRKHGEHQKENLPLKRNP